MKGPWLWLAMLSMARYKCANGAVQLRGPTAPWSQVRGPTAPACSRRQILNEVAKFSRMARSVATTQPWPCAGKCLVLETKPRQCIQAAAPGVRLVQHCNLAATKLRKYFVFVLLATRTSYKWQHFCRVNVDRQSPARIEMYFLALSC